MEIMLILLLKVCSANFKTRFW